MGSRSFPLKECRSLGGIDNVLSLKRDERQMSDDRILGSGDFVAGVLQQMEEGNGVLKRLIR